MNPTRLGEPVYATELMMFYSDRGLYVAFDMEQPAETLVQRHAPRDSFDVNRDTVGINLDSSGSGRYGYWMTLALGDGQMDGTVLPERQYNREWDGVWYGATARTERGWSAEFFVPWSQMAMPKEDNVRRINLYSSRKVAYRNERWGWPALPRSQPRFMSLWQPIEFRGVDPPPAVERVPVRVNDIQPGWRRPVESGSRPVLAAVFKLPGDRDPESRLRNG